MKFRDVAIRVFVLGLGMSFMFAFAAPQANALSCLMPVLNDEAIERADLIFQGKAIEAGATLTSIDPDDMGRKQNFTFSVDKLWKGSAESDQVTISRNIYWGGGFEIGAEYLVAADVADGQYEAPLCGNTAHISSAGDKLEILKMKFGTKKDNIGDN